MIIKRYLIREITQPMVLGTLVLVVIYASFSSADYLAEAVAGVLPTDTLVTLILLKIIWVYPLLREQKPKVSDLLEQRKLFVLKPLCRMEKRDPIRRRCDGLLQSDGHETHVLRKR